MFLTFAIDTQERKNNNNIICGNYNASANNQTYTYNPDRVYTQHT